MSGCPLCLVTHHSPSPCINYCLHVMSSCFQPILSLQQTWINFIDALIKLPSFMKPNFELPFNILPFKTYESLTAILKNSEQIYRMVSFWGFLGGVIQGFWVVLESFGSFVGCFLDYFEGYSGYFGFWGFFGVVLGVVICVVRGLFWMFKKFQIFLCFIWWFSQRFLEHLEFCMSFA